MNEIKNEENSMSQVSHSAQPYVHTTNRNSFVTKLCRWLLHDCEMDCVSMEGGEGDTA